MRLLGAVLAGGASRRFGRDKAVASWRGKPLIGHVIDAVRPQVDAVVVCGRTWPGETTVADRPAAGLGPLGGLAGALAYAAAHDFDRVLSVPCDVPVLPVGLVTLLGEECACFLADCPVIGSWPAALAQALECHLTSGGPRAVQRWALEIGAMAVALPDGVPLANVNFAGDLAALDRLDGA